MYKEMITKYGQKYVDVLVLDPPALHINYLSLIILFKRHVELLNYKSFRVFEIRRTEGGRFSAGPTNASCLAVLLSAKHFFVLS